MKVVAELSLHEVVELARLFEEQQPTTVATEIACETIYEALINATDEALGGPAGWLPENDSDCVEAVR